jgi:hypothetical protein
LAQAGVDERCQAQLWRARDIQLRRDVALTVLMGDVADVEAAASAQRTLDRAMRTASFTHTSISRLLDVLGPRNGVDPSEGVLGIVVAEWTPGVDLVDLLADGPLSPGAAARLLEPLTAAVEAAHHAGLVLGTDHPQRIRFAPEGQLRLAFPGPWSQAAARDDVRGLGAVLYLLMTGRWPLRTATAGLPGAPVGVDGRVVSPRVLRPVVPVALATVALRSLEDTSVGGIRTSAAILAVLERSADSEADTDKIQPIRDEPARSRPPVWSTEKPARDPVRRRKLALGVAALGTATVAVLAWLAFQLVGFFSDSSSGKSGPGIVIGQTSDVPTRTSSTAQQSSPPPAKPPQPIGAASVHVYAPVGDPDRANRVDRVIDGDSSTTWKTDVYRQQFPAFKPGIGIMTSFADAAKFVKVGIDSPSQGTVVEIRTAPAADAALADTKVVGQGALNAGHTEITLSASQPTPYLLVWITTLSTSNGGYASEIGELTFLRTE